MNTDWTGIYTCKKCHKTESRSNHITTDHKEGEQTEDRRNVGEESCNSGDGTDQTGPILDDDDDDVDLFWNLLGLFTGSFFLRSGIFRVVKQEARVQFHLSICVTVTKNMQQVKSVRGLRSSAMLCGVES